MARSKRIGALTALLLGLAGAWWVGPAQAITFSDGTFDNANWTASQLVNTNVGPSGFAVSQVATGGNPGSYRQTRHDETSRTSPGSTLAIGDLSAAFTYDPSVQGAITNLDFAFDLIQQSQFPTFYSVLAFQNGTYYIALGGIDTETAHAQGTWVTHHASGLDASDFTNDLGGGLLLPGSGPAHPDFSASGSAIVFGYITATGACCNPGISVTRFSGLDNLEIVLDTSPPARVSEPSAALLLGTGFAGLLGLGRLGSRRRSTRD